MIKLLTLTLCNELSLNLRQHMIKFSDRSWRRVRVSNLIITHTIMIDYHTSNFPKFAALSMYRFLQSN